MAIPLESFASAFGERDNSSIVNLLLRATRQCPHSGIDLVAADREHDVEFLSYPDLLEEARCILGGLLTYGHPKGSKVVLLLERPRDVIPAFWACVIGGYVPCPMAPIRNDADRWTKHLTHVEALLDQPLIVTTRALKEELKCTNASDLDVMRSYGPHSDTHIAQPSVPAVLMLTSGSTGNAKAVELTHSQLLSSMAGKAESQALSANDIALNWIAFDHVAALLEVHMIAQYVSARQVHIEPSAVLADPLLFLRLIDRHRVSLAFAPNFLLGQINAMLQSRKAGAADRGALELDLSCLRYIVTGGEANVVDTGRRFLDLLAPYGPARNALRPAFGMTETSAASVYSHDFPDCDVNREFAAVGRPITGFEMRLVNEDGTLVTSADAGELQVRGPMVFKRYHNNPVATREAFTADGWFRTGDLGRIEEGRLRLVGRSKDCIIVSGVNYFSHELETTLESLEGIERSYVAAFSTRPQGADTEQLVVAFATRFPLDDEAKLHQLAVAVRNTAVMLWGFRPAVILPLPKGAFPKTSLGKIQRSLMRKRLEAGGYLEYQHHFARVTSQQLGGYSAPEGPVEIAVAEIYTEILGLESGNLSATASFFDLGGTSLDILKLTRALARRLGAELSVVTVLQDPTVRALAARIERGANEYDPIVSLQLAGQKTPLFCVHPGNGSVLILVSLAKYFVNDRPFCALRPRGFNRGEKFFETFEEMVSTYLDAICKRQPHGPYALAGYSVGCPIVFEIARRLESRGERVRFLGCIDEGPSEDWPPSDLFDSAISLSYVLGLIDADQAKTLSDQRQAAQCSSNPCDYVFQFARRDRLAELDLDLPKFSAWAAVAQSNHTLVRAAHVTTGMVESTTVFCSSGWGDTPQWHAHLKRWDRFTRKPNKYIDVAGNHMDMMGPKHVAGFQSVLRAEIDLAMGGL